MASLVGALDDVLGDGALASAVGAEGDALSSQNAPDLPEAGLRFVRYGGSAEAEESEELDPFGGVVGEELGVAEDGWVLVGAAGVATEDASFGSCFHGFVYFCLLWFGCLL